jgi:hypothetical protein
MNKIYKVKHMRGLCRIFKIESKFRCEKFLQIVGLRLLEIKVLIK